MIAIYLIFELVSVSYHFFQMQKIDALFKCPHLLNCLDGSEYFVPTQCLTQPRHYNTAGRLVIRCKSRKKTV